MIPFLLLAFTWFQGEPASRPAPDPADALSARPPAQPNLPRVSFEAAPPVWIEGGALNLLVTFTNQGAKELLVPFEWTRGSGFYLRELPAGPVGRPAINSGPPMRVPGFDAARVAADAAGHAPLLVPAGARLTVPVLLGDLKPPAGDAFELLFFDPAAIAEAHTVRVERVENLVGARALVATDFGDFVMELAPQAAPLACRNFVKLAESGYYDGVAFHRIVRGLCVQAGDPDTKTGDLATLPGSGGRTFDGRTIPLERSRAIFERGTVGLARIADPLYAQVRAALAQEFKANDDADLDAKLRKDWPSALQLTEKADSLQSGSSQFFICTSEARHFNGRYAAFAKVVSGLDVVEKLEAVETLGAKAPTPELAERPAKAVRIRSIRIQRAAR